VVRPRRCHVRARTKCADVRALRRGRLRDSLFDWPDGRRHVDNFISAGGTIEIPGAGARAFVTGPLGEERVRVIFTHSREPVCAPSDLAEAGPLQTVVGGGDALHRDLQVVATHEPSGRLTMIERILHSVSGAPAPDGVVVIVPGQN
jgi:hypothetical protein